MRDRCTAVLDVGKTHSKLSLWNACGELLAHRSRANGRVAAGRYGALDAAAIEEWIAIVLCGFAAIGPVGSIIPVGHGAAAAVLREGRLACPPFDYESAIPGDVRRRYDAGRDPFAETGSPALPDGLNLGAQLHWLEELMPDMATSKAVIVPWAQYWAWVLSGVAAAEVTSLGCHTDLWNPVSRQPSALAHRRGWDRRLAPLRRAGDVLGRLRPDWVARTGLAPDTQILCGLHDSNAALLAARGFPEVAARDATVISTGTWFVAMRSHADRSAAQSLPGSGASGPAALPEGRDCLVNVDVGGIAVPSARFMGGRELELLTAADAERLDAASIQEEMLNAVGAVVDAGAMALPTLVPGCGPYPHAAHVWKSEPRSVAARRAAIGLYAAQVMRTSLSLIGARETIVVEGRFAAVEVFTRGLASLFPDARVYASHAANSVSYGALRLVDPDLPPPGTLQRVAPLPGDIKAYAAEWDHEAARRDAAALTRGST